jgi:SAM-dependent methyltransferase
VAAPRLDAPASEENPRPESAWWGVHVARYRFAAQTVGPGLVLDVACGSGYGLAVLSPSRRVIGVDVDAVALRSAAEAGPVVAADASALPFRTDAFDAVVTFETIEHLNRRSAFVDELARVVVPGGALVLSTPNALYTRPQHGRPQNPFHVFEYEPEQLRSEVTRRFEDVRVIGQHLSSRFVISPFIEDQRRMPRTARAQVRLLVWRILNKLPSAVRDRASQAVWGHPLYPAEDDYVFSELDMETAPVLVASARAPGASSDR